MLAGGNLNLGQGTAHADLNPGTNLGIVSIGQSRDPYLPFQGAEIIVAAGLGDTSGLGDTAGVDYKAFENAYLNDMTAPSTEYSVYLPDLAVLLGVSGATNSQIWNIYSGTADDSLTPAELTLQSALNPLPPAPLRPLQRNNRQRQRRRSRKTPLPAPSSTTSFVTSGVIIIIHPLRVVVPTNPVMMP